MSKYSTALTLTPEDRSTLESWVRAGKTERRLAERASPHGSGRRQRSRHDCHRPCAAQTARNRQQVASTFFPSWFDRATGCPPARSCAPLRRKHPAPGSGPTGPAAASRPWELDRSVGGERFGGCIQTSSLAGVAHPRNPFTTAP